ncbi:MAG: flagellar hook-associated protein 1 FlgK [Zhongshania sp.]|jgi:flagellar hook-associated protein 1 FlgK
MGDMLGNALSALVSNQRALATVSHNIANAGTEGYSRQRVDFNTRVPEQAGNSVIGSGVLVSGVSRVYDSFTAQQLRSTQAAFSSVETTFAMASQLDNVLADPDLGISASLSRFYNSVQDVADDPSSITSRQLMLAEARGLGDRFADVTSQLDSLDREVNSRIKSTVNDVNDIARHIADINELISSASDKPGKQSNDLLDQRDQALLEMNKLVGSKSIEQDDGTVSVFIGSGEALVLGSKAMQIYAAANPYESGRTEVAIGLGGAKAIISSNISGGSLGGSLNVRDNVLIEVRNELGRIAVVTADALNAQNRAGLDLNGNMGGDIFDVPAPNVYRNSNNASAAEMTAVFTDTAELKGENVVMRFDGANWAFSDEATGAAITGVSGSGSTASPFQYQGVEFSLDSAAAAGDRFVLRPTEAASGRLKLVMTNPAGIAAAAATRSSSDAANISSASISETEVVDSSNSSLLASVDIEFLNATTYQINGTGSFAYTPGAELNFNGNKVVINGQPVVGDHFYINPNTNAVGDNRNILKMAGTENLKLLNGGTLSAQDAVNGLLGDIAVATRSAQINLQSQDNLLTQTRTRLESISGVNLDEEAADLLRYQQAYQAAAQASSIARDMFQALLSAIS